VSIRCALTVRLPHRPVVRVEQLSDTPTRAFRGCLATLERQLKKYRERRTERRRRPKKYYVAKRLLAEGLPPDLVDRPRRAVPEDG
jgi:ribosome-associated translation inhibitor RaiA